MVKNSRLKLLATGQLEKYLMLKTYACVHRVANVFMRIDYWVYNIQEINHVVMKTTVIDSYITFV